MGKRILKALAYPFKLLFAEVIMAVIRKSARK